MCAVTLLAYSPLRQASFVFEDANWRDVLGLHSDWTLTLTAQNLSNAPWAFHAGNVLIHLLNVGLIAALLVRLHYGTACATLAAGIFAIHPLNSEAVSYIAARGELLSGFWLLLALWIGLSNRKQLQLRAAVMATCIVLAMLAKTSAIVVVGLIPAMLLWHRRYALLQALMPYGLLFLIAGYARLVAIWQSPYSFQSAYGAWDYMGLQSVALVSLLSHVFNPFGLTIDPDWASASSSAQAAAMLLVTVAVASALTWRSQRWTALCGWIALCVWPRFVMRPPELLRDHHLYLSMIGIATAMALALTRITEEQCGNSSRHWLPAFSL